ncbi:MAG: nucleoside-diphosphate kinase [Candidatus Micrarchaeota archaeon]|nr:nucleoside-diphosphate kinase [Candidatus Micrarchaeota archaeon]MDE1833898.1 nucleoside-diphosphate kinase [Candidatus Micrarchaeota archaeon]MDE1860008.1 nucleoside-diphosphate kinase [Candidatus Micrarchaeota archaeon]
MDRALVLIKPDGIERALVGKVITKFEDAGLKITAIKMVKAKKETVEKHYTDDKEWLMSVGTKAKQSAIEKGQKVTETEIEIGMRVRNALVSELTRMPIVAFVLEGNAAADVARKIGGATEPRKADPSSIRGQYASDSYALADIKKRSVRNIVHISENAQIAEKEIKVWFGSSEICSYKRADEDAMYG